MPSKEDIAEQLAHAHYNTDPTITQIFRYAAQEGEDNPDEPIKLLELNGDTSQSGVIPVYFGPDAASGVYYPSVVIEIHPSEYPRVLSGSLPLPDRWDMAQAIPRPQIAAAP